MNRILILTFSLFVIPFLSSNAQSEEQLIDTKYEWFGGRLVYSAAGQNLNFKDLTAIMNNYPDGKTYMELARKNKNIGIVLASLGTAGIVASFLGTASDIEPAIFWPSLGVFIVGSGFLSSSRANVQKAVNSYNQNLYKSKSGMGQLDLKLSPIASGLVFHF
jgi:hypothetical protein